MSISISLDQFFDIKEKNLLQLFVFLLDREYLYLNNETTWLDNFNIPIYIIRMALDDFHSMDFATHPKVLVVKKGKELFELSGLPSLKYLQQKISQI